MNSMLERLRSITNYQVETLSNGAKLITHYRSGLSVNISIKFDYGTAYEVPEKRQAAHFAEHMMFRKGPRELYRRRQEELEHLSANGINATTSFEYIGLGNSNTFVTLPRNAPKLLRLVGDMIYDDRIEDEFLEAERQIVLREVMPKQVSEHYAFCREIDAALWGAHHPYFLAGDPCVDNVKRLSQVDVREVFEYLGGKNVVVSIVGPYDQETLQAAREVFGTKYCTKQKRHIENPSVPEEERILKAELNDVSTPYAKVIFRLPEDRHEDTTKAHVLAQYLDDSSKLQRRLRDEGGLCYGVGTTCFELRKGSSFGVQATNFNEGDGEKAVAAIKEELEELKDGKIDQLLLERRKEEVEHSAITYESAKQSADIFSTVELFGVLNPYDFVSTTQNVTAKDLRRLARTYFNNPVIAIALHKNT
ncbi:MAG: insulinase family protein [Candidatus Aenigmarchaeota archaeon]|nr:insulinase family protein [Candidatus Aenigmarchaeota archaeon]